MSYDEFSNSPVGTFKELDVSNGRFTFVKVALYCWLVQYAVRFNTFFYVRFSATVTTSEAYLLFDYYSK